MKRLYAALGHTGAVLTLAAALLTPFVLIGWFQKAIGRLPLRIDPQYSGGETAYTIERQGYRIEVNRPAKRQTPFQRSRSFVKLAWRPASALPSQVSDEVDVDGDGRPDLRVNLDTRRLAADITPRSARFRPMHIAGTDSFSRLVARVNDWIEVRVPIE